MAGRLDLTIEQGASYELPLALQHSDGTVYNLTGYTGRGQIRKYHRSTSIVASFTVTISTPTDGTLTLTLTATETATMPCGEEITDEKSKYVYDLEIVHTTGTVKRILDGYVYVSPEVTR
jgi:uncharacterized protein (UPF0261 family)